MRKFNEFLFKELMLPFEKGGLFILLFIGPIFLTFLFGCVYVNDYVNDIPIVILDQDNSSKSRLIVSAFVENERYDAMYYAQSTQEMQQLIDTGKAYMGVFIPPHLEENILKMQSPEVVIYTDGTNPIIGNNAYANAAAIVQTIGAGVEMKYLQAKGAMPQTAYNISQAFTFNDRVLYDSKMTYMNYLLLCFIAVFLQVIMLSAIATSIFKTYDETISNNIPLRLIAKIISCGVYTLLTIWTSVYLAHTILKITIVGNVFMAFCLSVFFVFAISGPAIFLASFLKDKVRYSQIAYTLSFPTFLTSGCVWPVEQMPTLLLWLVRVFWPLINFAKPFHEILLKGVPFSTVANNFIGLIIFATFWLPFSIYIFKKRATSLV